MLGESQKRPKIAYCYHCTIWNEAFIFGVFRELWSAPMPYIMYSKFRRFICFILFFVVLVQNFIRSGEISVFRAKIAYFRSLPLGVCVPTSSPNRAAFERITCLFGAQLVPFSSPDRTSFEPKKIFFRAQIVPISCPNRASFEPCSCCYRALFELLSSAVRAVIEPFHAVSIRALAV